MLKKGNNELRKVYVDTLIELCEKDRNVVALEADLAGSIGTKRFKDHFPDNFIDCGIMEANMMGVAAGLSLTGKRPFVHTFGPFATRRVFDQVFISLAYANLSATILGSDCGVTSEFNGGTHMPFEDVALMRSIPTCNVVEATDEVMLKELLMMSYEKGGLWYIRTSRKNVPRIYADDEKFELGKAKVVREGKDAAIFAYGICVADALEAAEELKEEGIDVAVIDSFSISPFDKEMVAKYADRPIITVENHNITNGLGSAAAEALAESGKATKFVRMGVKGRYGQTGSLDYLKKDYGIDKDSIKAEVKRILNK
ncbi:transketolase family protein [Anaeropeptidivorans aminofermentans]|jgi:transketolase|uniref:transketolase family protein n=1 Tax=Anaeropeptidivorans aminofermentans TaxID=2934315 RepID=UPI0020259FB9|nr:transketolase C-terminal domain-containing protein [Anaeropeptidivorans aminofermentans]